MPIVPDWPASTRCAPITRRWPTSSSHRCRSDPRGRCARRCGWPGLPALFRSTLRIGRAVAGARATPFVPRSVERVLAVVFRRLPRLRHALSTVARRLDRPSALTRGDRRASPAQPDRPDRLAPGRTSARARTAGFAPPSGSASARRLCVHGWDNLTNTGLIHELPDRILAWNETQRRQAIDLHGAQPGSVVVTGAWPYDHWFGLEVSRSRDELCRELGLDPGRPIILYACSSRFIAEHERDSVTRWIEALRSAPDERFGGRNVIVRPHPLNRSEWTDRGRCTSTRGDRLSPERRRPA